MEEYLAPDVNASVYRATPSSPAQRRDKTIHAMPSLREEFRIRGKELEYKESRLDV